MDTTDYHCCCAVFMLSYSCNSEDKENEERGMGEEEEGEEDGEWVYFVHCHAM